MEQIRAYPSTIVERKPGPPLARFFAFLLISLSILISMYLLYRYALLASNTTGKLDVCSAIFGKGCDSALKSDVSSQLGLPLSAWGLLYYLVLLTLMLSGKMWRSFQSTSVVLLLLISFLGCLASITLLIMMIIDPKLFCPFCITLHVMNLLIFLSLVVLTNMGQDEFFKQAGVEVKSLFSNKEGGKNKKIGLIVTFLVAALSYSGLYLFSQNVKKRNLEFSSQNVLAGYNASSVQKIQIDEDDPVLGDRNSPIEIIVFSDFQCEGCRYFSAIGKEIYNRYPGKVHLVYKYFPLNKACNDLIETNIHPRGCEVAWAAEAARQQGKFWEFHDSAFYYNLDLGRVTVCSIADKLELDHKSFEIYRTSDGARNKITRTVAQAKQLGIMETPSVYINGRLLRDFQFKAVETVVRNLLNLPPMIYPKEG